MKPLLKLILPIQDNVPEAKAYLIGRGNHYLAEGINVRLARERVDYYVPLQLTAAAGDGLTVEVQGLPGGVSARRSCCFARVFGKIVLSLPRRIT